MLDIENALQQEALGIVGVNLRLRRVLPAPRARAAARVAARRPHARSASRSTSIEFSGIEFRHVDNRVMSLRLVQLGLTGAAMFSADGKVLQPSEVLYKKPVLVERGSFRPVTT